MAPDRCSCPRSGVDLRLWAQEAPDRTFTGCPGRGPLTTRRGTMIRFALLAVAVGVSLVGGRVAAQDDTTEISGTVRIPATVLPFEKGTAQLLLFKYNPNNLDEPAQRVSEFEIKDIKHEKEKVTEKEFKF